LGHVSPACGGIAGKDCELSWNTAGIEIPNNKYQTNHNDQNSKFQTAFVFWSLNIGI
jgi:hypothetical protein